MENVEKNEHNIIPGWLFSSLFGQTPGFYYTCAGCDYFLKHECKGDKNLYYPTECDMCSFGGELLSEQLAREEDEYYEELEEQAYQMMMEEEANIYDDSDYEDFYSNDDDCFDGDDSDDY